MRMPLQITTSMIRARSIAPPALRTRPFGKRSARPPAANQSSPESPKRVIRGINTSPIPLRILLWIKSRNVNSKLMADHPFHS